MVAKDINQKLVIFDKSLKTDYQTTYQLTTQLARTARQSLALPRIDKNASDRAAIINPDGFPPGFKSTSRAEFHPDASALCATYERERPAFDRVAVGSAHPVKVRAVAAGGRGIAGGRCGRSLREVGAEVGAEVGVEVGAEAVE